MVVIAGEHHIQALGVTDFLADRGHGVELLGAALCPDAQLEAGTHQLLDHRLLSRGVTITPLTECARCAVAL